jgi:5-methylcytosine-specific restriction endonuclease McrA
MARDRKKQAAYNRKWNALNRERKAALFRAWIEKPENKARKEATTRVWREKNKERVKAYKRASWHRTKPNGSIRHRTWAKKNREHEAIRKRAWHVANPDKVKVVRHARRARKRSAPGSHTAADLQLIRHQQGDCCAAPHCRRPLYGKGELDHILPLKRGGSNWPSNLQWLCHPCNNSKGIKTMEEWLTWRCSI